MATLVLKLRSHTAKYLRAHMSDPLDLCSYIGSIIAAHLQEDNPAKSLRATFKYEDEVLIRLPKQHHRSRIKSDHIPYWVPPKAMEELDKAIENLFRFEVLTAIEYRGRITKKEIFELVRDKYGITPEEFTIDALMKMEQRYRNKRKAFICGR